MLAAYTAAKGNMNAVYRTVMLSNPLDDEDRYRALIDAAIAAAEVEPYKAYVGEKASTKARRMEMARREGEDAEEHAKTLGVDEKLFGAGPAKNGGRTDADTGLAALIQQRQKGRAEEFFEKLEAKYAGGGQEDDGCEGKAKSRAKKVKKRTAEAVVDEPPEEAFRKTAERAETNKKARDGLNGGGGGKGKVHAESHGTRKSKRAKK